MGGWVGEKGPYRSCMICMFSFITFLASWAAAWVLGGMRGWEGRTPGGREEEEEEGG